MSETIFLPGRKQAKRDLGRVLILGLGVSGKACALYLAPMIGTRVEDLVIYGGPSGGASFEWAFAHSEQLNGAEVIFDTEDVEGAFDLCIASPGISEFSDFYLSGKRASKEIVSEVEFAWRESDEASKWVAITGTNGKTTTTSLTSFILERAGWRACAVGNIGDTCIEAVGKRNAAVSNDLESTSSSDAVQVAPIYVVEMSSYQLASTTDFAPDVAVILGITPDHLTWHKTHENYAQAKFKLLANLKRSGGVAVLDAINDKVRSKVRELKAASGQDAIDYIPIGTSVGIESDMREACGAKNSAFVDGDSCLHIAFDGRDHVLIDTAKLMLEGRHNQLNALAAASACVVLGLADEDINAGLASFAPLEHRIEPAGSVSGIDFFNDSKATNVDATLVAITAFLPRKPIVLLGGRDKLSPLDDLVCACAENAKGVVCYGESKSRFIEAFVSLRNKDGFLLMESDGMKDALDTAFDAAERGDVILLSPACASFDEFSCFEERGEVFKKLVLELAAGAGAATDIDADADDVAVCGE